MKGWIRMELQEKWNKKEMYTGKLIKKNKDDLKRRLDQKWKG